MLYIITRQASLPGLLRSNPPAVLFIQLLPQPRLSSLPKLGMERRKEYLLPPRGKPHPSNHFLFLSGVLVVQLLSRV